MNESKIKFYTDIKFPFKYNDIFPLLTKAELTEIYQQLQISKLSQLNKLDLINAMLDLVPERILIPLTLFDHTRYSILKKLVKDGYIPTKNLYDEEIAYFQTHALAFPIIHNDNEVMAIPEEVKQFFTEIDTREYREAIDSNTLILDLISGMLYYYGAINLESFLELMQDLLKTEDMQLVVSILVNAVFFYDNFHFYESYLVDGRYYFEMIIREQEARPNLNYHPYSGAEFMAASEFGYLRPQPELKKLKRFIKQNWHITEEELTSSLHEIYLAIQLHDQISGVFEFVGRKFEIDDPDKTAELFNLLIEYMNHVNRWILKGHTPNSLIPKTSANAKPNNVYSIKTKSKIGRNDPCPCGSGKKLKHCCG